MKWKKGKMSLDVKTERRLINDSRVAAGPCPTLSHPGTIGIMIIPNIITFINEDDNVNGDMLPDVMAFKMMKLENYRKKSGDTLRQKTKDKRQKTAKKKKKKKKK